MTQNRVQLFTSLTPGQCVARIRPHIDSELLPFSSLSGLSGSKQISGEVTENSLRLHERHPRVRPPFHAYLTASVRAEGQLTIIDGEVHVHGFILFFLSLIFIVTALSGIITLVSTIALVANGRTDIITFSAFSGFALAMLAIAFGVVRCGRHITRDATRFLTDFLIQTLEARKQPVALNQPPL